MVGNDSSPLASVRLDKRSAKESMEPPTTLHSFSQLTRGRLLDRSRANVAGPTASLLIDPIDRIRSVIIAAVAWHMIVGSC